ncbi:hypothetical protein EMIT0P100_70120 [Pseudomonas sp. IT-P100]
MNLKGCINLSTEMCLSRNKHKNKDLINFSLFNFYNPDFSTAG